MSSSGKNNIIFKDVEYDPFADLVQQYPTTEPQREIWTNVQIGGHAANCAYNESVTLSLKGTFNTELFWRSVSLLFERHDALRSSFSKDGLTVTVLEKVDPDVPLMDLSSQTEDQQQQSVNRYLEKEVEFDFDLENGPLGKVTVIRKSADHHLVILTFHHIVCDGWSLGIIMQDLGKIYSSMVKTGTYSGEPAMSYRDYAYEEENYLSSDENLQTENFWVNQYRNNIPAMDMPLDKPRPAVRTFNAKRVDVPVDSALVERIKKIGARQGCSYVTTLVSAFEVFIHRISGLEDIVTGLPAAGQSVEGKESLVGHAVNLLPLRTQVDSSQSFNQYLKKRKPEILDAYDHQRFTFGTLINKLNIPRDPSRIPLVPVSFNVDIGITNGVSFSGCEMSFVTNPRKFENFELFINATGSGNQLTIECTHNTDLFDSDLMRNRMEEFVELLKSIVDDPEQTIAHLNILPEKERKLILEEWNSAVLEYDRNECIHHRFEKVAAKFPHRIALRHLGRNVSFADLNERANRLAHLLISRGTGPESLIGICMERSVDMIVAMYAVLKSGSAYVPVDPVYPVDRISFILNDARAQLVLTDDRSAHLVKESGAEVIDVSGFDFKDSEWSADNPRTDVKSHNQAYNIYTSGSTGKPKGVTIEHRNVMALTAWADSVFSEDELDGVLGSTTICFDLSIFEIFVVLCLGGRLILVKDILGLQDLDKEAGLKFINTVPSAMAEVMKMENPVPATVCTIIMCGEPLPVALVNKIYASTSISKVYDLYGPTEDTVYSTCKLRKPDEPATIGKVIPNSSLYLLDKNLQPVPAGLPGEMFLGGDEVARGYLFRPELTAEKFIPDPFSGKPGARMYRTGDLARFRPDGEVEFIGRIDNQVKIRGFRIELGEIDSVLARHPAVRELVSIVREDEPGDKRIVSYIVTTDRQPADISQLRAFLRNDIPEYMVPSYFVFLDSLPMTPNNKIDRKALPKPGGEIVSVDRNYEEPKTPVEEMLANIWCDVLGVVRAGRKDNFFELGGHSIIAVRMFNEIEKQLGVKIQLPVIFRAPSIAELAQIISNEELSKPWSCLVPLNAAGNKRPLFCIHMHNGNIHRWRVLLKHLGSDQPVYAIQPRGLDVKQQPHYNIEEMATYYIDVMKQVQPEGPYNLLGLCFSGMVVFEMALQLQRRGEKVNFLGMINNYAPPENPTLYRVKTGINKFMRMEMGERLNYVMEKNLSIGKTIFSKAKSIIGGSGKVEEVQIDELPSGDVVGHDLRTIHSLALLNYHPVEVYQGDITVIRTGEPIEEFFNEKMGWDRLVSGKIEISSIDGSDNDTIITDEPYNAILSGMVRDRLGK